VGFVVFVLYLCPKVKSGGLWGIAMRASSYLKKLYNLYNKEFFGGKLDPKVSLYFSPSIDKAKAKRTRHRKTCATTYWFEDRPPVVVIRKTATKSMRHIMSDLLHEMVHLSKPGADCTKDGVFQEEVKRLANAGALVNVL
jgi:hypothetical protein